MDRKVWPKDQHESHVEKFYGTGIEGYHDYHHGYLNFGYWTREGMTYLEAAENLVMHLGKKLGLDGHSALLDIGCGMGTQDLFLIDNFHPRSIDGLDVTWKHVARSRERAARAGVPKERLEFHHGSAVRIPFPDNSFTHLLSIEAPEHFDTREAFFKEAFRVLKPGGVMVLSDYSQGHPPRHFLEKIFTGIARRVWQMPRANVYGKAVYLEKLKAAGFVNVTIDDIGAQVIPGYYHCHRQPEVVAGVRAVRGFWMGVVGGFIIDLCVYGVYRLGICEYVVVRAEKP